MTLQEYKEIAIRKVIELTREQGVKFRRADFVSYETASCDNNYVFEIGDGKGIMVACLYAFSRCGKALKTKRNAFLNYANTRIMDTGVFFTFSLSELDIEELREDDADQNKIEEVMRKVEKLLALADTSRNPSEQEAISASMQAQKLLAKYNLDAAMVTGQEKKEDVEQVIADIGAGKKWRYTLAQTVANSYCCKCFYSGNAVVFYGYKSDSLIARRVFVYLFEVGNRLANSCVREYREIGKRTENVYNSFCIGFVSGVDSELSRHCKALMLVVPQEVSESYKAFSADFKQVDNQLHQKDITDYDAMEKGYVEGKRALNAQYLESRKNQLESENAFTEN